MEIAYFRTGDFLELPLDNPLIICRQLFYQIGADRFADTP